MQERRALSLARQCTDSEKAYRHDAKLCERAFGLEEASSASGHVLVYREWLLRTSFVSSYPACNCWCCS